MGAHNKTVVASVSPKVKQHLCDCLSNTGAWKKHAIFQKILENGETNFKGIFSELKLKVLDDDDDDLLELISHIFVLWNPKHPFKSLLLSLLKDCNDKKKPESYVEKAFSNLCNSTKTLDVSACHIIQTYQMCVTSHILTSQCLIAATGAVDAIAHHIYMLSNGERHSSSGADVVNQLGEDFKCVNSFVHKHFNESRTDSVVQILHGLKNHCHELLEQEQCRGPCWNAAALLLANLYFTISSETFYDLAESMFSIEERGADLLNDGIRSIAPTAKLALCNGILVFLSNESSNMVEDNLSHKLLNTAFSWLKIAQKSVVGVQDEIAFGRCVLQWSAAFSICVEKLNVECKEFPTYLDWILPYTSIGLDDSTDLIRHQAREVLENVLKTAHVLQQGDMEQQYVQEILRITLKRSWHKRAIYVSLYCILKFTTPTEITQYQPDIVSRMITAVSDQSLAPYASNLHLLMAKTSLGHSCSKDKVLADYMLPILKAFRNVDEHHLCLLSDYCLKKVLRLFGTDGLDFILLNVNAQQHMGLNILIMCLSTAQQLGLLKNKPNDHNPSMWKAGVNLSVLQQALVHPSNQLRVDAYSLICQCCKPSELLSEMDLDLIKTSLPYNMTSQCPAFRQQLFKLLKKLFSRIKLNITKVCKDLHKKAGFQSVDGMQQTKTMYETFLHWLMNFSFDQLFEGACYSRRNTCLNLLSVLLDVFSDDKDFCLLWNEFMSTSRIKKLLSLLYDNYEENREMALNLLLKDDSLIKTYFKDDLHAKLESAIDLCRKTYKPEECKDAAYGLRLIVALAEDSTYKTLNVSRIILSNLQHDVQLAEKNLVQSLSHSSLFSSLHCIRMLLINTNLRVVQGDTEWRKFISECINVSISVFGAVFSVVGSISPEGHLPEVMGGDDDPTAWDKIPEFLRPLANNTSATVGCLDERLAAQRVLVSCWRSAKESSLLLQSIADVCPCDSAENVRDAILSRQQLLDIGLHLRRQLMNARHRGAFEIAYSAFKAYCPLLWRHTNRELSQHPIEWLNCVVEDVCDPVRSKSLCSTRRSAGLPFLAQALLSSDKGTEMRACLRHAMTSLLEVLKSNDEDGTPKFDSTCKVHALNVAQGIIRDASLGEEVQPFLSAFAIAAIKGIACRVWSVRNSSTLLFSALMTRIFGVKREKDLESSAKNRMSSHEFVSRLPELREFLLEHLKSNTEADGSYTERGLPSLALVRLTEKHARVYPDLLLLARLYPSPNSTNSLTEFVPYIMRYLASPILKIRATAAAALSCVLPADEVNSTIDLLCSLLVSPCASQNALHGHLLALMRLRAKLRSSSCENAPDAGDGNKPPFLAQILTGSWLASRSNPCPMTRGLYLDLLMHVMEDFKTPPHDKDHRGVTSELAALRDDAMACVVGRGLEGDKSTNTPGRSFLDRAVGKFVVRCYFWKITTADDVCRAITCSNVDLQTSALDAFLQLNAGGSATDSPDHCTLFSAVLSLIEGGADERALILAYRVLPCLTSVANCDLAIDRGLRLAANFRPNSGLLASAVVSAARFVDILHAGDEENRRRSCGTHKSRLLQLAIRAFDPEIVDNAEVRRTIAGSIGSQLSDLLLGVGTDSKSLAADAWRMLFAMLIDEDEQTRRHASLLVHKVALECGLWKGAPFLDSLALETAADCLFALHGASQAERCRNILGDVSARITVNEADLGGARESRVFARGERSTYAERHVTAAIAAPETQRVGSRGGVDLRCCGRHL